MPHLLNVWPNLQLRLQSLDRIVLLLDFDGTLAPIVSSPELAVLPAGVKISLTSLSANRRLALGVISGRALSDVSARVGVPNIIYAGNHGLEMTGPEMTGTGEDYIHPEAAALLPALCRLARELRSQLAQYAGVLVEDKGLSLSVHYRLAQSPIVPQVEQVFDQVVSPSVQREEVKITRGKMVLEVRPNVDWDKGKAVHRIIQAQPPGSLPIFVGDDATDEAAFQTVQESGGIAVFVGPPRQPTQALHRVDSPAEVAQFLRLLSQW